MNTEDMRKYFEEQNGVSKDAAYINGRYMRLPHLTHVHSDQQELWEAFKDGVEWARNNPPATKPVPEEFLKWLNAFVEVSDLSGIDDKEEAWTWPAPPNYPDVFAGYPVLTVGVLRSLHAAMINAAEPPKDL